MRYFTAVFVSPLALLLCRRWFQFIPNLLLYVLAWLGLALAILPFVTLVVGAFFWALGVVHAVLVVSAYNKDRRHRELLAAVRGPKR